MQKLEKRASVLLWSIFLSMVVLIAFISINYQVSKNLKENIQINKFANLNNEKNFKINEALGSGKFENINLSNNEIIVFENGNYQI
ncbi:MAG: hypothetical protein LBQ59_04750 [Candidatus Peribacteria bacterium]|jgi:hypothetical protein|nr:hypothetical protein [Candidatus Peribacteria bacterium]